jgi:hypothetical protein
MPELDILKARRYGAEPSRQEYNIEKKQYDHRSGTEDNGNPKKRSGRGKGKDIDND